MARIFLGLIILTISTALIVGLFGLTNEKELSFNKIQQHKVVEINAQQIDTLSGKPYNTISVYAVKDDVLQATPFQLEEFEHLASSYEKNDGKHTNAKGIFDASDLLVFMLKDSGKKPRVHNWKILNW